MDDFLKQVYLREVERQCRFAVQAADRVGRAMHALHSERAMRDAEDAAIAQREVFRNLHSLLTHASNVSRLLWPPSSGKRKGESKDDRAARNERAQERGRVLRDLIDIGDVDHPLRSRELRDHLEHFDERLDEWAATSQRRVLAQDIIGPPGAIVGIGDSERMRDYDPITKAFGFRGVYYDMQELVTALDELAPKAERKWEELMFARWGKKEGPNAGEGIGPEDR